MFQSTFFITLRRTQESFWQPVMMSRRELDPGEGMVWSAGFHYSERHQAEQAARRWAKQEGTGYEFIAPEEAAA